jgi:glyoxylase-like metal-dependent hydrolase (beta-lactamase superfamily II)
LVNFIKQEKLTVTKLINTHCHIDHVLGNKFIKDQFGVNLLIPEGEQEIFNAVPSYAAPYGFSNYIPATVDGYLPKSGEITFGETSFEILFLPGHSPGHLGFINTKQKVFIGGDVLFDGSIGRTDLPGGDHETLINSIQKTLFTYEDDVKVYCGHGPSTTLGKEKKTNPFCALQ